MTADLDLSPEAVERLANDLEHANEYEPLGHDGWTAAALLRAARASASMRCGGIGSASWAIQSMRSPSAWRTRARCSS